MTGSDAKTSVFWTLVGGSFSFDSEPEPSQRGNCQLGLVISGTTFSCGINSINALCLLSPWRWNVPGRKFLFSRTSYRVISTKLTPAKSTFLFKECKLLVAILVTPIGSSFLCSTALIFLHKITF